MEHRQFLGPRPAIPPGSEKPRQHGSRPHLHNGADGDRDGKTLHRARAKAIQTSHGNKVRHVGIENGAGCLGIARFQRIDRRSPVFYFLTDAFIDQDIRIKRGAKRQHNPGDAGQRQRCLQHRKPRHQQNDVEGQSDIRKPAQDPIGKAHIKENEKRADRERDHARANRIRAQFRAHRAFFNNRQRRRQGAGAEQHGKVIGGAHGKGTADLPLAAGNGFADHGRADHLFIQHNGEGAPDIGARDIGKAPGAGAIEGEIHHPFAGAGILPGAGIGQVLAIHGDIAAHRHAFAGAFAG